MAPKWYAGGEVGSGLFADDLDVLVELAPNVKALDGDDDDHGEWNGEEEARRSKKRPDDQQCEQPQSRRQVNGSLLDHGDEQVALGLLDDEVQNTDPQGHREADGER